MRTLYIRILISFFVILSLISCSDNPAIVPPKQPFLQTSPHGDPHYPVRGGKPIYPDKTIYYPDGTAYKPECHFYYWYHPKAEAEYGCDE